MMSKLLWSFLVIALVIMMDQTEGWRRRRRCPRTNCAVSSWTSWSNCTQPCGTGGTQRRTRKVTRPASCGGSCPALSQTQACNRGCSNGGTPIPGRCNCKPGYSGRCCTRASTPTSEPAVQPSPTRPNHGFMILCLPVAMKVNISRNFLPPSMDPSLLHLNDPGCSALQVDQKFVIMKTPLEGCGTVRRSIGRRVLFHNKVVVPSAYGRKRSLLEFPFACTYNEFGLPGIRSRPALFHKRGHVMDSTSEDRTME